MAAGSDRSVRHPDRTGGRCAAIIRQPTLARETSLIHTLQRKNTYSSSHTYLSVLSRSRSCPSGHVGTQALQLSEQPQPSAAVGAGRPMRREQDLDSPTRRQGDCRHASASGGSGEEGVVVFVPARECGHDHLTAPPFFKMCRSGFDVYVNMVLEDVTEYEVTPEGKKVRAGLCGMGGHCTCSGR